MGNALVTLFGDIAAAIKAKNGEQGIKYKPAEFPGKISAIEGTRDPDLKINSGEITPTSTDVVTIWHGLGVLPDAVFVFVGGLDEGVTIGSTTGVVSGEAAYSAEAIAEGAQRYVYTANGSNVSIGKGIYEVSEDMHSLGCVREATLKTFKWGGSTSWPLLVGATYRWVAIGGIKTHPTYLNVTLDLDGEGGLIVHGGVTKITQLEIYVDGTVAKTVDYVHSADFTVDISDVAAEVKEYTISVKAIGDELEEAYPYQFFEPVTGWVLPKARGTCGDDVTWRIDGDGVMTISGTGPMSDYSWGATKPWAEYIPEITAVVVEDGVTTVGNNAFCYYPTAYTNLRSVTLADSVSMIGSSAFAQCTSLKDVILPEGVSIGESAFTKVGVASLTIPDNTTFANSAFQGCTSLANLVISEGVSALSNNCFNGCTALTSVTLPDSITEIGMQCFASCTGLTGVAFGSGLTSVAGSAFYGCTSLNNVVIPDSVVSIGDSAFKNCTALTTVTIGSGVTSIGRSVFQCTVGRKLTKATFKNTTGWWVSTDSTATSGTAVTVTNASTAAQYLGGTYYSYYWFRS